MCFKVLVILLVIANIVTSAESSDFKIDIENYLQQNSIIYALATFSLKAETNPKCQYQLEQLRTETLKKSPWAIKVLDASGQSVPGFLYGQNYWLGDREICKAVQRPVKLLISNLRHPRNMNWGILNETAPFDFGFYIIYLEHNSPWQVEVKFLPPERTIEVGLCAPVACKVADLSALIEQYLKSDLFAKQDFYELNAKLIGVKQVRDWKSSSKLFESQVFIFLACLMSLTVILILSAVFLRYRKLKNGSAIFGVIKCFDIIENSKKLFNIKDENNSDIAIISGIRSIISIIIVFLHVGFYSFPTLNNKPMVLAFLENGGTIFTHTVVDFFFTISGFLQSYKFFSHTKKLQSIRESSYFDVFKEFSKRLFHRWLRLAPLFYTIICFDVLMVTYLSEVSVYQIVLRDDLLFKQYWWRYLTFTFNFLEPFSILANWTWSMACELQFFIAATLLLLIYTKQAIVAKICFLAIITINIACYYYNGITYDYGFHHDDFAPTAKQMYINPFVRCTPYLMGLFIGWYLSKPLRSLSELTEHIIGNSCFVIFALFLSPLTNDEIKLGAMATSVVLTARISHSLWTCWLLTTAVTKRRAWCTSFLELGIFRHFGRLSYALYLINPIIIILTTHLTSTGIHMDQVLLLILYLGFVLASYFGSIICTLSFEIPYCNLSSLIINRK